MWLEANCMFFKAIADAINHHNEQLRQKAVKDFREFLKQKDEESEDESATESEVVVETVTTISKS